MKKTRSQAKSPPSINLTPIKSGFWGPSGDLSRIVDPPRENFGLKFLNGNHDPAKITGPILDHFWPFWTGIYCHKKCQKLKKSWKNPFPGQDPPLDWPSMTPFCPVPPLINRLEKKLKKPVPRPSRLNLWINKIYKKNPGGVWLYLCFKCRKLTQPGGGFLFAFQKKSCHDQYAHYEKVYWGGGFGLATAFFHKFSKSGLFWVPGRVQIQRGQKIRGGFW